MPITDAFTAANGTDIVAYSANWAYVRGTTGSLLINTNAVRPVLESLERAVRRVGTFPNAHYAQIGTNTASGNENEALGPAVRCQAAASNNYYGFYQSAGTANYLFENTGATWTQLGSTGLNGSDAGDTEKLDANGSTLTPTINGSGTGTPGAQTDTTYTTGAPGITWFDSVTPAGNWDNFECTDLAGGGPLPPYPVRQQTAWRM